MIALLLLLLPGAVFAGTSPTNSQSLADYCLKSLTAFPGETDHAALAALCQRAVVHPDCTSTQGRPIFSIDWKSENPHANRILVFALIHGDEWEAGELIREWILRLNTIHPRNNWRVIPILNPDGVAQNTRYNADGVDLNRNFPSIDWPKLALKYWKKKEHLNKRRFPGNAAASEPETRCAMEEIEDYQPALVISVHSPYGLLDFDGPRIDFPRFSHLPWRLIGTYPGSLGRYMWIDHKVPVFTVELRAKLLRTDPLWFKDLQDVGGLLAIRAAKRIDHVRRPGSGIEGQKKTSAQR